MEDPPALAQPQPQPQPARFGSHVKEGFDAVPAVWPTQVEATCPVCSALPLQSLYRGVRDKCLEYVISSDPQIRRAIHLWSEICDLCKLVRDADLEWTQKDGDPRNVKNKYLVACGRPRGELSQYCHLSSERYRSVEDNFERVVVHADPFSAASLQRIREWIERCDREHDECEHGPRPLPERLIDVRDLNALRLYESSAEVGEYVALSHCWGNSEARWVTTTANLAQMQRGFSLGHVPKTLRDAIRLTHSLGLPYLWVDALCILQDDMNDWKLECAKMADVYSNAYLTISASNAADDEQGFLNPRHFMFTPLWIHSATSKQSFRLFLQTHDDFIRQLMYFTCPEPLHSRGWTLQEWYLSPRILDFGSYMTTLECRSGVFEDFSPTPRLGRSRCDASRLIPCMRQGGVGHRHWADMVSEYTKRAIKWESDQLPAVAGIAAQLAKRTGCTYCAGIWWEDMPFGLLWKRQRGYQLMRPSRWVAPTWSWASLIGAIYFPLTQSHVDREALESVSFEGFFVQTEAQNPFGEVQSGLVKLKAILLPLLVTESPRQAQAQGAWMEEDTWELETEFELADYWGPQHFKIRGSFDVQEDAATIEAQAKAYAALRDAQQAYEDGKEDEDGEETGRETGAETGAETGGETINVWTDWSRLHVSDMKTPTTPICMPQTSDVFALMLAKAAPMKKPSCKEAPATLPAPGRTVMEGILVKKSKLPSSYERKGYVRAVNLTTADVDLILASRQPEEIILY